MTGKPEGRKLVEEAREQAHDIQVFVDKYRKDPENYMTTHEELDGRQAEADWWNAVANALDAAGEKDAELEKERDHSYRARAALAREKENVRSVGRTAQELREALGVAEEREQRLVFAAKALIPYLETLPRGVGKPAVYGALKAAVEKSEAAHNTKEGGA